MFLVVEDFTDIKDNRHVYRTGDEYPRPGVSVSEARIEELATGKNKRGIPLIKQIGQAIAVAIKNDEEGAKETVPETEPKPAEDLPKKIKTRRRAKKPVE